jgi:hypothetical protein
MKFSKEVLVVMDFFFQVRGRNNFALFLTRRDTMRLTGYDKDKKSTRGVDLKYIFCSPVR